MISIEKLQAKALALFSRYGVRSVNMDELAFHMGVSKRTLYQLFSSKEELIQSLFEAFRHDWEASVEKILQMPKNSTPRLIAFYKLRYDYAVKLSPTFLSQASKFYPGINSYIQEVRVQIKAVHQELLSDASTAGLIRKPFNVDMIAESHELVLDFIIERLNVPTLKREQVCQHLIFAEMAGIIDPDHYEIQGDLNQFIF